MYFYFYCTCNVWQLYSIVSYNNTIIPLKDMTLPVLPKKEPKTISVTVRLSPGAAGYLKTLAKEHGLSQAEVIDYLVKAEYKMYIDAKKTKTNQIK